MLMVVSVLELKPFTLLLVNLFYLVVEAGMLHMTCFLGYGPGRTTS